MYRQTTEEDRSLDIEDRSRSSSPKNMKFYKQIDEEKTLISQTKKSFCIDALLSRQIEPEGSLQERAQQKYLAMIQNKNFMDRFSENENYDSQIEQTTIDKFQQNFERSESPRSGQSSVRSGSPGSDDGNRSGSYSPPISPGVEGGNEEYETYRPGKSG
jgi:hypothetical protein